MYDKEKIIKGVALALLNAKNLVEDSTILFKHKKFSSAYVLIVTAREEVGKSRILYKKYKNMKEDEKLTGKEIQKLIIKHPDKIRTSLSMVEVNIPKRIMDGWRDAAQRQNSAGVNMDTKQITELSSLQREQLPNDIHNRRMVAEYVDVDGSGGWKMPDMINRKECFQQICLVASEVSADIRGSLESNYTIDIFNSKNINKDFTFKFPCEIMLKLNDDQA